DGGDPQSFVVIDLPDVTKADERTFALCAHVRLLLRKWDDDRHAMRQKKEGFQSQRDVFAAARMRSASASSSTSRASMIAPTIRDAVASASSVRRPLGEASG